MKNYASGPKKILMSSIKRFWRYRLFKRRLRRSALVLHSAFLFLLWNPISTLYTSVKSCFRTRSQVVMSRRYCPFIKRIVFRQVFNLFSLPVGHLDLFLYIDYVIKGICSQKTLSLVISSCIYNERKTGALGNEYQGCRKDVFCLKKMFCT